MFKKLMNWMMNTNSNAALEFGVGFAMGFFIISIALLAIIVGALL